MTRRRAELAVAAAMTIALLAFSAGWNGLARGILTGAIVFSVMPWRR